MTELVVSAFYDDPTWAWAFPDLHARRDQHRAFWRLFVEGALRYPWVWLAAGDVATSVWIPDPAHRGRGHGLRLLADNLRRIDAEGASAHLEASNPANVPLYERYGFRLRGAFDLPDGGPTAHTMWRTPRGVR